MKFPMTKCDSSKSLLKVRHRKRSGVQRSSDRKLMSKLPKISPSGTLKWSQLLHFEFDLMQNYCENASHKWWFDKRDESHESALKDDTASSEQPVSATVVSFAKWSRQLPAGFEKLLCTLLAIFLGLFLLSTQFYIWFMERTKRQVRVSFCTGPSTSAQVVSFECHLKLLIAAWLLSILTAFFVLAVYFLYWLCIDSHDRCEEEPTQSENKLQHRVNTRDIITNG